MVGKEGSSEPFPVVTYLSLPLLGIGYSEVKDEHLGNCVGKLCWRWCSHPLQRQLQLTVHWLQNKKEVKVKIKNDFVIQLIQPNSRSKKFPEKTKIKRFV